MADLRPRFANDHARDQSRKTRARVDGALDEDYSKSRGCGGGGAASETPSPSSSPCRAAQVRQLATRAEIEHAKVLEELPFDVKRGAAFAKFGPVATLDLDGGQDEFDVDATPATPAVVANVAELF